jgi:microcin C transport system substrate-binding protein
MIKLRHWAQALLAAGLVGLSGCGKSSDSTAKSGDAAASGSGNAAAPVKDAREEAKAYYAKKSDFFHFKTPADLPGNLKWESGEDLPEIGSPEAKKGGTLNGAIQDFPRTVRHVGPDANGSFRPWILDDNEMAFGFRHPNRTEVTDVGFRYFPGLATAWAVDRPGKTVYIKINPLAHWSDGPAVTSDDMIFMFYMYQSPFIQAPWYNNFYTENYSGITRYDEHTFALHMPTARPDILSRALELRPVPAHFYKELGADYTERYQWRPVPTSGPYVLHEQNIDKGRAITLVRNQKWWAKDLKFFRYRYNPDRIRLTVIRDTPKAFEAFRKGDLDMFGLALAEYWYDKLPDSDPDVQKGYIAKSKFFNEIPRPTYGLWMNESKPYLDNRDVRIGINYACNWQLVIEKFSRGDWSRMNNTSPGYGEFSHPTLRARPFDIAKAQEHFAKAGFKTRGPDGILVNDKGEKLSFQLSTGYEALKDVMTILREEALKAGLELRLEVLDGTAGFKKAQEKKHDITFTAFAVSPELYPRYWETNHSANAYDKAFLPDGSVNPQRQPKVQTNNLTCIAYPELDKMIERYDRAESIAEMKELAFKMEELLSDDASFCPGFITPFIRNASWRWVRHPADFNLKIATTVTEHSVFWIEEPLKKETLDARRSGKTFPVQIKVYDQYKEK